jgi:hypothetical protein
MRALIAFVALVSATPVLAQALPLARDGRRPCPYGYTSSGAFCAPVSDRSRAAIPKPVRGVCPTGWNPSGGACLKT